MLLTCRSHEVNVLEVGDPSASYGVFIHDVLRHHTYRKLCSMGALDL